MAHPNGISPNANAATGSRPGDRSELAARAAHQGMRGVAFVAGLGLLLGFFLPWIRFGQAAAFSGLSLMVSGGTVVDALAGPSRGLLIIIPACGAALVASAILAPRWTPTTALISGGAILLFGFFTLARLFLNTVGIGMWIVVVAALVCAGIGVASIARGRGAS